MKKHIGCLIVSFIFLFIIMWLITRVKEVEELEILSFNITCLTSRHSFYVNYKIETRKGILEVAQYQRYCTPFFNKTISVIDNQWETNYNHETLFILVVMVSGILAFPIYYYSQNFQQNEPSLNQML